MINQPAEMIDRLFTAFNARDIDAVLAGFDPEVDWPDVSNGTRLHGHAQVRAYWELQFATINPLVEPLNVTTDDADGKLGAKNRAAAVRIATERGLISGEDPANLGGGPA